MKPYIRTEEKKVTRNLIEKVFAKMKQKQLIVASISHHSCSFIEQEKMCDCRYPCQGYKDFQKQQQELFLGQVYMHLASLEPSS